MDIILYFQGQDYVMEKLSQDLTQAWALFARYFNYIEIYLALFGSKNLDKFLKSLDYFSIQIFRH